MPGLPQNRQHQAPDERQDSGDDRQLDCEPEAVEHGVEVVAHEAEVEVVLTDEIHRSPSLAVVLRLSRNEEGANQAPSRTDPVFARA